MATKAELLKQCEELGIDTAQLSTNKLLEEAISAKKAELDSQEDKTEKPQELDSKNEEPVRKVTLEHREESTDDQEEEDQGKEDQAEEDDSEPAAPKSVYTDRRGRKWRFKETAPATIRIDGHPMTQQEILDTEDVIAELVYGNNSFLTQTH